MNIAERLQRQLDSALDAIRKIFAHKPGSFAVRFSAADGSESSRYVHAPVQNHFFSRPSCPLQLSHKFIWNSSGALRDG